MIIIDFYILTQMMFFDFLQKPFNLAFSHVVGLSLNHTQNQFQQLFEAVKYETNFTGQTNSLRHYLNDIYDLSLRRIEIHDTDLGDEIYLFNASEGNEETYIFNTSESGDVVYFSNNTEQQSAIHFEIHVPSDILFNEIVFRKHVDQYVLAGLNYEIVIV